MASFDSGCRSGSTSGFLHLCSDDAPQSLIAGQAQHEIDAILRAPAHQSLRQNSHLKTAAFEALAAHWKQIDHFTGRRIQGGVNPYITRRFGERAGSIQCLDRILLTLALITDARLRPRAEREDEARSLSVLTDSLTKSGSI